MNVVVLMAAAWVLTSEAGAQLFDLPPHGLTSCLVA
jgi:hypothetical protein